MQREWFDTYFDHNFCCFTLVCQKFSWFLLFRIKLRLDCYSWIFKYFHWKFNNFELIIGYLVALLNFKFRLSIFSHILQVLRTKNIVFLSFYVSANIFLIVLRSVLMFSDCCLENNLKLSNMSLIIFHL